jgi:hypothetical protein
MRGHECGPTRDDGEPRINTVGSGTENVSLACTIESIIVGQDGCPSASRTPNECEPQQLATACAVSSIFPSSKCIKQRFSLLQVGGVEALGEPAIDRREQVVGFSALALLLPQAHQAHRRPQLQ